MPTYSVCGYTPIQQTFEVAAILQITPSQTDWPVITEISCAWGNFNGGGLEVWGLGFASSQGTPRSNSYAIYPHDPGDPLPAITFSSDWIVRPGVPTKFLRRISLSGLATSSQFRFVFPRGLQLNPSNSLVLSRISGNANLQFPAYYCEFNVTIAG